MPLLHSFVDLVQPLSVVMTQPAFATWLTLLSGWVFAGRRTITGMIRGAGAVGKKHHSSFHRLFATAQWSLDELGLALFGLMLPLLPAVIMLSLDDPLCRKRGTKMYGAGMHHDPLQSSRRTKIVSWGHSWVVLAVVVRFPFCPERVFSQPDQGGIDFHELLPPSLSDLNKLLLRIILSLLKRLATDSALEEADAWMQSLAQSVRTTTGPTTNKPPRGLCAFAEGFSLHAGVSVEKSDSEGRKRLARYCARPCVSLERLSIDSDGQVLYSLKRTAPGAPAMLTLSPTEFLAKLAALIPPPRSHLVRSTAFFRPTVSSGARSSQVPPLRSQHRQPGLTQATCAPLRHPPTGQPPRALRQSCDAPPTAWTGPLCSKESLP